MALLRGDRVASVKAHRRDARSYLWQRGLAGQVHIHHGDVAGRLGLHRFAGNYFDVLDALCVEELAAGGPMVTAPVTRIGSEVPGGGFYELVVKAEIEVDDPGKLSRVRRRDSITWIHDHPERASIAATEG